MVYFTPEFIFQCKVLYYSTNRELLIDSQKTHPKLIKTLINTKTIEVICNSFGIASHAAVRTFSQYRI
jgi:DeoR/GlpR family transcriptional regulator of sugar metabolism